jgi:hypothetical protein
VIRIRILVAGVATDAAALSFKDISGKWCSETGDSRQKKTPGTLPGGLIDATSRVLEMIVYAKAGDIAVEARRALRRKRVNYGAYSSALYRLATWLRAALKR